MTPRAGLALFAMAAAIVACGEAPRHRLTPAPTPYPAWPGMVNATEAQEAIVLPRLQPLMMPLMRRTWGLPPDSVSWRAGVNVVPYVEDWGASHCLDTTVAPSVRDRGRFAFCGAIMDSLAPTDTVRESAGITVYRILTISAMHARNERKDTLFVGVQVGAADRCANGEIKRGGWTFTYHFVRSRRDWRLVDENPLPDGAPGGYRGATSVCTPLPLDWPPAPGTSTR